MSYSERRLTSVARRRKEMDPMYRQALRTGDGGELARGMDLAQTLLTLISIPLDSLDEAMTIIRALRPIPNVGRRVREMWGHEGAHRRCLRAHGIPSEVGIVPLPTGGPYSLKVHPYTHVDMDAFSAVTRGNDAKIFDLLGQFLMAPEAVGLGRRVETATGRRLLAKARELRKGHMRSRIGVSRLRLPVGGLL